MTENKKRKPGLRFYFYAVSMSLALIMAITGILTLQCNTNELSGEQIKAWRAGIKSALYIPDPHPPLDLEQHGSFQPEPGVIAERISYGSQFGLRIPAVLYRPQVVSNKMPGLVIVNGHGGDKFSWYSFYSGILYARAGAAVLTFDPVGEGERNKDRESGTRAHDAYIEPREMAQRMGGLLVTDVMQAVSCLSQWEDVDSERIAIMGYSLGSFISSLTGAVDSRISACVLVGGGNLDGPDGYWDRSKPMCQGIPYQSLMFLGDRGAAIYAMHASRGPTLIYNGLGDDVVKITMHGEPFFRDLNTRTIKLYGSSKNVFETEFLPEFSHRPYFVTKPVALWLEKILDFPNWDENLIRGMKETHIMEWAERENVEMDARYATEKREGGTYALGIDVPGLPRDMLFVFSEDDWMEYKDRLIYESWVKEARSRVLKRD